MVRTEDVQEIAVTALVEDDAGLLLMIRDTDKDLFTIPDGAPRIGETVAQTVVRLTRRDTGVDVEVTGLVGIYSDTEAPPRLSLCFRARPIGGELRPSDPKREVLWVEPERAGELSMLPSTRLRVSHGLQKRPEPYYG